MNVVYDWLLVYVRARCVIDEVFVDSSEHLYADYCDFCKCTGDTVRNFAEFKAALEVWGYKCKEGTYYGLCVFEIAEDTGLAMVDNPEHLARVATLPDYTTPTIKKDAEDW